MKSNLNREAFLRWVEMASPEEKTKMVVMGAAFGAVFKKDDEAKLDQSYRMLQRLVIQAEEKLGTKIVNSSDGCYYRAFLMIAEWGTQVLTKMEEQKKQIHKAFFASVEDANEWLKEGKMDVVSIELEVKNQFGFMANHTAVKKVILSYRKNSNTKYFYDIFEEEQLGFFVKKNTEKVAKIWREEHPGLEIISQKYYSNARGDSSSLALGFGDYTEHLKIITLCRKVKEENKRLECTN